MQTKLIQPVNNNCTPNGYCNNGDNNPREMWQRNCLTQFHYILLQYWECNDSLVVKHWPVDQKVEGLNPTHGRS